MSFPRAKIKRFNDIPAITPSPADYNINLKVKHRAGCGPQSPPMSETGSTQSTPCFRTPTLIKKRSGTTSSKGKLDLKQSDKEILNAKIVECRNKDEFIKELEEEVEEMKNKIYAIEQHNKHLEEEKSNYENELIILKNNHETYITSIHENYKIEIEKLNETIKNVKVEIETSIKNKEIEDLKMKLSQLENDRDDLQSDYQTKIKKLQDEHKQDIENLQFEMMHCVQEAQKSLDNEKRQNQIKIVELKKAFEDEIAHLKQNFLEEKQNLNEENMNRFKRMEENMSEIKLLLEIQSNEKCAELENYWKNQLQRKEEEASAILKECQAISEYNIIQSELEKNQYKLKYEEECKRYKDLEKKYDNVYLNFKHLQGSYTSIQNKLYRLIRELRENNGFKSQIRDLLEERQTYQTAMQRNQRTIDILTMRLRESDQDVEQLKNELKQNEEKLLEYEDRINILTQQLEDSRLTNVELELNNESAIAVTQERIKEVTEILLDKANEIEIQCITASRKLKGQEAENKELLCLIKEQQELNCKANELITKANKEIEELSLSNKELLEQVTILSNEKVTLQEELDNLKELEETWSFEKEKLDLKIDILKNEIKCKQPDEQLKDLERKYEIIQTDTKQKDAKIHDLEKEIETMDEKIIQAESLGHQNDELLKINQELETKLRTQEKKIEKLRKENTELKKTTKKLSYLDDKENLASPNRSIKCESPGPLRELN